MNTPMSAPLRAPQLRESQLRESQLRESQLQESRLQQSQQIEIEIGELALTAPVARLRGLAVELERDLAELVTRELAQRIAAQGPEWRPAQYAVPDVVNQPLAMALNAPRQEIGVTVHAVARAVADAIWEGLGQ